LGGQRVAGLPNALPPTPAAPAIPRIHLHAEAKKSWDSEIAKMIDVTAPWRSAPHFTLAISYAF
jgi:hypothetical protein